MNAKPRVLIDARMVGEIPHGFARYVTALALGLAQLRARAPLPYEPVFLMGPEFSRQARAPGIFRQFSWIPSQSYAHALSELWILPREIKRARADLFHSPSYASLLSCPCPHVSTVHDLNHLYYGDLKQKLYYQCVLKPFLARARKVLTVSEFAHGEIVRWLKSDPASIAVVPNAVPAEPAAGKSGDLTLAQFGLTSGKFFLALSNPKPHKNLATLIEAYRQAREEDANLWPLILSIRPGALAGTEKELGIHCVGGVSEEDGLALLRHCGAVPFPSLYEGFGLPPLEAALAKKKVLVSDIAPHREALQDFAPDEVLWLSPTDIVQWKQALLETFRGDARLTEPRESSVISARNRFSVIRLGTDMDQIYRDVLEIRL